jgi:hypothetical protein
MEGFFQTEAGDIVTISGEYKYDPSIAYGVAVTDFGAASTFTIVFSTPIQPTANPTEVDASIAGGLTDFTGNGVTITPALADADGDGVAELQRFEVNDDDEEFNAGVDVGPQQIFAAGPAGAHHTYQFGDGPIDGPPLPAGPFTSLVTTLSFSLSGDGDIAALTGFTQILQVPLIPEPSTLVLAGLGALGLVVAARRRARSRR